MSRGWSSAQAAIIDFDRQHLYDGNAYILTIEYVMNQNQTIYQSFKTPNNAQRFLIWHKCYSAGRSEIQFWETPTGVVYNFAWTPRNRNRNSSNTSNATVQAVTSLTTPGTFLFKDSNYGSGITVGQSPLHITNEMLLAPNSEYIVALKSYDASNLTQVQLYWYEI
jgi:hypothetical protein